MSKKQNREEIQAVQSWECNWGGEDILRQLIKLSSSDSDGKWCGEWIATARAQDLFNTAAVLASGYPCAKDYLCGDELFDAKLDYCVEKDSIMYRHENGFIESERAIECLMKEYGRPKNNKPTVRFYIEAILAKKQLRGIEEAAELLYGCDRYIKNLASISAERIFQALTQSEDEILAAFKRNFVRSYALTALMDVICMRLSKNLDHTQRALLSNAGIL